MSDNERNSFATFLIIAAVMVFFLIMLGVVFGAYGGDGVREVLSWSGYIAILVVVLGIFALLVLLVAWIFNLATRNIVNFQAADDRGEAARMNAIREMMRNNREYDKDVRRLALPMARQIAKREDEPVPVDAWAMDDDEQDAEYTVME